MKRSIIVLSAVLCLSVFAVGCGNKKETKEPVKEEKKIEYMTVGNEKDATYDIIFKNMTGKNITAVSVKGSSEAEYPVNMMKDNEVWKNGDMVELYYTPVTVDGQTEETMWSMQLICDDETMLELTALDFNSLDKEVSVCYDESEPITYVEYKDKDGNQVSTREQEITAKEEAEAAAAAEAQAQAEAEAAAAAAQAQAEAEAAAAEAAKQQQYSNNSGYNGAAPSQNADNCLGGDALTY